MDNTLNLTLASGKELTLVAEYSETMEHDMIDSDGYEIILGMKPAKHGILKAYLDGKVVDSSSNPSSWGIYAITNEKALASGCTKGIQGLKIALTEQNAKLYKDWITNLIEAGTTKDASKYHAKKDAAKREAEKTSALNYIARAEKYMESGNNLMTKNEYDEWARNYNNVMNEGGEGYVPELPTKEGYEVAIKYIESITKKDT